MKIEIKRLTSELTEDYLHFFDTTPHSTEKAEHKCYCVCWASVNYKDKDYSTAEQRRIVAAEYISKNNIQGYLAYYKDRVVGWCNANTKSDCYECLSWQMFMSSIKKDERKVKSILCFAIAPEFRGKGISTMLLESVCKDAGNDGFDVIEAYPNKSFVDTEQDFMGPVKLYEKCGFIACYEVNEKLVMRKCLR
jgi:GNAT superfamily N-acetyltransferase